MDDRAVARPARPWTPLLVAIALLLGLGGLIFWQWNTLQVLEQEESQRRFQLESQEIGQRVLDRMRTYEMVLRGVSGLMIGSDQVSQGESESARAFNASVLANAAEGILVVGEDGRIQYANPAMAQMLEGDVSDMEGAELLAFLDNPLCADGWLHSEFYLHFRRGATYRVHEAMMRTLKGGCLPVALSCSPLPRQQHAMVVIALDMSVVRNLHAQLESQAVTDALTGLLNRRGFHRALESSLARIERSGQRVAVLYLDLDGFKRINDSLGHDVGDQLLRRVGEQLKACLRPYDSLARIGGDEFTSAAGQPQPSRGCRQGCGKTDRTGLGTPHPRWRGFYPRCQCGYCLLSRVRAKRRRLAACRRHGDV